MKAIIHWIEAAAGDFDNRFLAVTVLLCVPTLVGWMQTNHFAMLILGYFSYELFRGIIKALEAWRKSIELTNLIIRYKQDSERADK